MSAAVMSGAPLSPSLSSNGAVAAPAAGVRIGAVPPPRRAAPALPTSKSRELARAVEAHQHVSAAEAARAYRPPSTWSEAAGTADVVWGGGGANGAAAVDAEDASSGYAHAFGATSPALGGASPMSQHAPLPSPGLSSEFGGDGDRFSDAASWDGNEGPSTATPADAPDDGPDADLPGAMPREAGDGEADEDDDAYADSRSTYGHARGSSIASSMWAGRGAPASRASVISTTSTSGGGSAAAGAKRRAAPPMPGITPAMALRAQQMGAGAASAQAAAPALQRDDAQQSQSILDRSPMSLYSPATEGDSQWGRRPSHASSSGVEEFEAAERSAELPPEGALSADFEMLPSDAADTSRSTNATLAEEEEDVSRDTLSALSSDMTRSKSGSSRSRGSPRSPGFASGGRSASGGAARAPAAAQRKTRGRKDRSPVLSYADGEEEEQRLVALEAGPSDLQRMSSLGPKLKKNSPAPWELGAEEEEEMPSSGSKYSRGADGRSSSSSRPSQGGDAPSSGGSRGFGWPRPSTDGSRVPKSQAYPPSMPSSDTRGSLASAARGGGAVDLASEAAEHHELESSRRSRSKSVSSSAAGMLKGLGLAASATPAGKRGKFAKAFGRKGAPAIPGTQAAPTMTSAPSWHSAAGSDERGNSLSLPGSTSDEFASSPSSPPMRAHSPLAPQNYAQAQAPPPPQSGLPIHPLNSTGSMTTATSSGTITGGGGGGGRTSTSAESGGGASVQSTRSSGPTSTAATSPASAAPQHLNAFGAVAASNGPTGGLSAAGAPTRGLKEPAFLPRTPSPSPRSPSLAPRPLQTPARSPSGSGMPRNAGGVGYKRSSTFLADGQLVPRGPSPGASPLPSPNMSGSGQFTFPNPNSRSTSASGHMSPESYMGAPLEHPNASTSQLDLRTSSATPTSQLLAPPSHGADTSPRGLSPSLMSGSPNSLNMSRAASFGSMNGVPPMPMPVRSSSTGGGDAELPGVPGMPGSTGMSSLPSVGAHEGVPYKLISLQEARELQERERAARGFVDTSRSDGLPQAAPEGKGMKNKKSGFMRMFGKEKNADDEQHDRPGMSSRPSQNSLEESGRRTSKSTTSSSVYGNAGAGRMPSFTVNGSAAPSEESTAAPALSLRPVSSMFLGFGAEMLDPTALGITADESDKTTPATSTPSGLAIPEDSSRHLPLPASPALINRSVDSHSSGGGAANDASASYSNGIGSSMPARKAPPAGLALSAAALRQANQAPPRTSSSVRSSEFGSPSYHTASHDDGSSLPTGAGKRSAGEDFASPLTSPTTPAFASSDAGLSSLGHASTHGQQHSVPASSRSLAVAHSRLGNSSSSSAAAAARPHSSASTHSESGSSALALGQFPSTPAPESTATLSPAVGGGNSAAAMVRTRALEIEAAIAELAAELTALRTAAGAAAGGSSNDSLLAPVSPLVPSSPIPPCDSCGCNCAEQKRAQALNEAAVLKSVSILNRSRAIKPSQHADAGKFGGYTNR